MPFSGFHRVRRVRSGPRNIRCWPIRRRHLLVQQSQIDRQLAAMMRGMQHAPPEDPDSLARHIEEVGKPLCPCNFYPDKAAEAKLRRWICACDEMQKYKYCHCLLFVTPEGVPITEYLPEGHEGRDAYGLVKDPSPDKGRAVARVLEKQGQEGEGA